MSIATCKERERARRRVLREKKDLGGWRRVEEKYGVPRGTLYMIASGKRYATAEVCGLLGVSDKPRRRKNWRRKYFLLRRAMERYKAAIWNRAHVYQPETEVAMIREYRRNGEVIAITSSTFQKYFDADMELIKKDFINNTGFALGYLMSDIRVEPCECQRIECDGWALFLARDPKNKWHRMEDKFEKIVNV